MANDEHSPDTESARETEDAQPAQPAETAEIEPFLRRHKVFLRRGRDTSHQCLFFLGLLADSTARRVEDAIEEYRGFGLEQIRSLVRSVHLPEQDYDRVHRWLAAANAKRPAADQELQARVSRAIESYRLWRRIYDLLPDDVELLRDAEARSRVVRELRTALAAFLDKSQPESRVEAFGQSWLPDLLHFLHKNLASLWAILLLAAVAFGVPAVSSLLYNEGWGVVLPLVLLLLPLVISRGWSRYRRWRTPGVVPFWDLSGAAFRSFRNQAREPGRLIERWPKGGHLRLWIVAGHAVKIGGYLLWWAIAFAGIFLLYERSGLSLNGSSRTVFLVLSLFYAVLLFAHLVDFWEYLDPQPVRFFMLLAGIFAVVSLLLGMGRPFFIALFLGAFLIYLYAYSRDRRSPFRLILALLFLVLAAANVKGWTTHDRAVWSEAPVPETWQRLDGSEWPWPAPAGSSPPVVVMAASGGGSRAAVYTAMALDRLNREYPDIAAQLQAISSVSGGSLASAGYIARLLDHSDLAGMAAAARSRELASPLEELQRAAGEDFLYPTLKGALVPGMTRGDAIEQEWNQGPVQLGGHRLSELARRWREARGRAIDPPFPIPLFNSATLDGHDVVITPLTQKRYTTDQMYAEAHDLKKNLYFIERQEDRQNLPGKERRRRKARRDARTWVYYRDAIYSLEDLLPHYDPLLSQAVRASANFPFGFPLVRVRTDQPLVFSPKYNESGTKEVMLTDGGTLSNSGMWSLFNLLMPDEPESRRELKRRGVLLLVVEASKMPQYPKVEQSLNALWSTIGDQGPVGQRLHRLMFDTLEREYGDRIALVQLDIIPDPRHNVLTSWALDRGSLELLDKSFETRWGEEKENLRAAYDSLTGQDRSPDLPRLPRARFLARNRPPLD